MQEISLSPSLSQKVYVTLGGQNCAIKFISAQPGFTPICMSMTSRYFRAFSA
jgi:hypothetical protein